MIRLGASMALLLVVALVRADEPRTTTVGMAGRLNQVVLPGSELEVKPLEDRRTPIVLRIAEVFKHGTAHRYDLVYYGLEPGTFDLKDYLRRKDGASAADLPSLSVTIQPLLAPGQVVPNALEPQRGPALGGYRWLLIAGAALWVLGLVAIVLVGRRKKAERHGAQAKPATLADRLRPLVEQAMAGSLGQTERAELERTLLAFWRRRLHLDEQKPLEAFAELRRHAEAGPLLVQLEHWLHRPGAAENVDVTALLRPYQNIPAESADRVRLSEPSAKVHATVTEGA